MKTFAEIDTENGGNYLRLLSAVSKLSGLFSESDIPYINYRVVENVFCRSFGAQNLSRSDAAYDASYNSIGIGIKTFICKKTGSIEKVAEFNSLSSTLRALKNKALAIKVAELRNLRIEMANRLYGVDNSAYHIVGRIRNQLVLFDSEYDIIDLENIHVEKEKNNILSFSDGKNDYSFNLSKSTLYRKFIIPSNAYYQDVSILENPYDVILGLLGELDIPKFESAVTKFTGNYVILPLYGLKGEAKKVFEKSGINQWNAGGRKRDSGEIYIPIPVEIHKNYPDFFPNRHVDFELKVPTGEVLTARICQDGGKALMTNPNNALADWLLRKVLNLKEGELATIEKLENLGFDSVVIYKNNDLSYSIDKAKLDSYPAFIKG